MQKKMRKLPLSWFEHDDVVQLARLLLGKIIRTEWDGVVTSARIVETEAYAGVNDRASHAYGSRNTARTAVMYERGGTAYVYLCYGIHHLFNVVTNKKGIPHAVLIRGVVPVEGTALLYERLGKAPQVPVHKLAIGPGLVSKALGISAAHTGLLLNKAITIWDDGFVPASITATPRIGIDYAGADKDLLYRFVAGA